MLDELLVQVRLRFYSARPLATFQRDRRQLLATLSWPATWLDHRGLFCSPARYRALVVARLDAIRAHGDPACYGAPALNSSNGYFPRYLLKCLQDFFDRHGDELYDELKHLRNALEVVCGSLRFAEKAVDHSRQIGAIASVHRLLRAAPPSRTDPNQLPLF